MGRMIDAEALKEVIDGLFFPHSSQEINEVIDAQPTIYAQPVRHGRWIKQENGLNLCSVCGVTKVSHLPFCGHCGARMDATNTNVGGKGGDDSAGD